MLQLKGRVKASVCYINTPRGSKQAIEPKPPNNFPVLHFPFEITLLSKMLTTTESQG